MSSGLGSAASVLSRSAAGPPVSELRTSKRGWRSCAASLPILIIAAALSQGSLVLQVLMDITKMFLKETKVGTSLRVQWLRICLPMQGT